MACRVFAKSQTDVDSVVTKIVGVEQLRIQYPWITALDVGIVANGGRYKDSDCGATQAALKKVFAGNPNVYIHAIDDELCVGVSNALVRIQHERGHTHSLFLSPSSRSYMNDLNMAAMLQSVQDGRPITCMAIKELENYIRDGIVTNTFCLWEIETLLRAGLFDPKSAQVPISGSKDNPISFPFLLTRKPDGTVEQMSVAGTEELRPAFLITNSPWKAGSKQIGVVIPKGGEWDKAATPADYQARHEVKLDSKLVRIMMTLSRLGITPDFLKYATHIYE